MNYWVLSLVFGICAVVVALYLLKRTQNRTTPRTEENEIIIGDSEDGPVVKKGQVDED